MKEARVLEVARRNASALATIFARRADARITKRSQRAVERCTQSADHHTEENDEPETTWPLK